MMKLISCLFFILNTHLYLFAQKGNIQIQINNCKSDKGKLMIALYDSEANYMQEAKAIDKKIIQIKNGKALITFENLPYKKYAFVFFHDENANQKLDTNFFGIPKEGYGFSNDAKGTFGAPSFSKSSFDLKSSNYQTSVKLNY